MTAVLDHQSVVSPAASTPHPAEQWVKPLMGEGLERYLAACDAKELRQLARELVLEQAELFARFVPAHLQREADYSALTGEEEPVYYVAEDLHPGRGAELGVVPTQGPTVYQRVDIADA